MAASRRPQNDPGQEPGLAFRILNEHTLALAFVAFCAAATLFFFAWYSGEQPAPASTTEPIAAVAPDTAGQRTVRQRLPQSAGPSRVGIVSGHRNFDSGAVCADGLTEAQVNAGVSEQVVDLLRQRGLDAEMLDEFDERLIGYVGMAVISIHADSCQGPGADRSGYKTSASDAAGAGALEACIITQYGAQTGLAYDPKTIKPHMIKYHAFNRVAPTTPAIILEIGFMGGDRALLTPNSATVAQAIADGIICFVEQAP